MGSNIKLSDQQIRILSLTALGYTAHQVGEMMNLSRRTVECSLSGVRYVLEQQTGRRFSKTQQAIMLVYSEGLLRTDVEEMIRERSLK